MYIQLIDIQLIRNSQLIHHVQWENPWFLWPFHSYVAKNPEGNMTISRCLVPKNGYFAKRPIRVADAVAGKSGTVPRVLWAAVCLAMATLGNQWEIFILKIGVNYNPDAPWIYMDMFLFTIDIVYYRCFQSIYKSQILNVWNVYLHLGHRHGVNVGKHYSTMEHLGNTS